MKCAYCDNEGKMSREHVIPKGFIEHMNFKEQIVALDKAPTRVINSEITVKDVCATCNNGYLSVLDSYGLNLILKYNDKISVHTKKIQFKYNYDLLTRWLLKICYNMARANDGHYDISLYKKNVDYIMNRGEAESNIIVFAMFMGTGCLDEKMEEHCDHLKKNRKYDIDWFRIGQFRLQEDAIYYCASKFVIVNSFAFLTCKMMQVLIAVIATLIVTAPAVWALATNYYKKVSETKLGNAEEKAREIIDEALKTAETKKRESLLEVKEESIRTKNELDKDSHQQGISAR